MVGRCGVSHEEFMEMELWQIEAIIDAKEDETKDHWERTRMMVYAALVPHSKGSLTPQKAMPLPWDKDMSKNKNAKPPPTSKEEKERLMKKFK